PADTTLAGTATACALHSLLAADVAMAPSRYAVFQAPADGSKVTADVPPTFSWQVVEASHARVEAPARAKRSWLDALSFEGIARADTPALTGRGYLLALQRDGVETIAQVFTTETSYTPTKEAWSQIQTKAQGKT